MEFAHSAPLYTAPELPAQAPHAAPPPSRPAGFWIRLGAGVVDGVATLLVGVVPVAVAADVNPPYALTGLAALLMLFMYVGYAPVMLAANEGATWGKQACEQRVVISDGRPIGFGRALLRELVVKGLMSALILPFWVSALMVGVRRDKRGLHDLIVGTRVVRDAERA
jgi:uncharacterized RDD family membrane protein YckC